MPACATDAYDILDHLLRFEYAAIDACDLVAGVCDDDESIAAMREAHATCAQRLAEAIRVHGEEPAPGAGPIGALVMPALQRAVRAGAAPARSWLERCEEAWEATWSRELRRLSGACRDLVEELAALRRAARRAPALV